MNLEPPQDEVKQHKRRRTAYFPDTFEKAGQFAKGQRKAQTKGQEHFDCGPGFLSTSSSTSHGKMLLSIGVVLGVSEEWK